MKVIVQCDDVVKFFKNVTKVESFNSLDTFSNKIVIYQGKKKTTLNEYQIHGFKVEEA